MCDVVNNYGTIGIPVVHRREAFISLLPCCVPYLEFHRCLIIEGDSLSEEGCADRRLSVVIELILRWAVSTVKIVRMALSHFDKAQH